MKGKDFPVYAPCLKPLRRLIPPFIRLINRLKEILIMTAERTFSIIKPDATKRNLTGAINAVIEKAGLRIVAQKRLHLTEAQAKTFLRRA